MLLPTAASRLTTTILLGGCCLRHTPPPRASLIEDIEASVRHRFDGRDVTRVLDAWKRMSDGHVHDVPLPGGEADPMLRQQSNSYVDGLPVSLFYEEPTRDFPWAHALEQHAQEVRDEFLSVVHSDVLEREGNNVWTGLADIRDATTVAYGPEWRTLGLQDRGVWDPINMRLFPKTVQLLKRSGIPCVEAFFAKMPAGTSIGAHSDGCNFHLTSHLGIDVPEGECWLKVGDQRREWREGKVLLFDTSVMHSAANEAARDRYVLMMRVWHPDLQPVEVEALSWIFACLDDPSLAARPPVDWGGGATATPAAPRAPAVPAGASRKERRAADKAAKKGLKKTNKKGFAPAA